MKLMPVATLFSKSSVVKVNNLDCRREETYRRVNFFRGKIKSDIFPSFAPSAPLLGRQGSRPRPASRSAPLPLWLRWPSTDCLQSP